jgi:large repetitive protein
MQQISDLRAHTFGRGVFVLLMLCFGLLWSFAASAQHTSTECPAQTGTVSSGGTVTINISDCEAVSGLGGDGAIDGGSFGAADFENHGTATTRHTGGQWFLDYSHNGSTGIGSTDVFELSDGSLAGNGDVRFTITINPSASPITVAPASLPTLTAATAFSQTLTSSGGVAPYTYTLQSGVLPVGLTLSSGGVLSGTPTQRGAYSFSVRSTDSTTPTALFVDKGYTGTVQNPTLSITPVTATAIQSVAFSQALSAIGGVAPYSCLLETGTFPAGISISSACVVSGTTAAAPGNYPVTIRVTDASTGPGSYFEVENFTLTVSPPPSVSIAVAPASVSEDGATNLTYTVTRSLNLSSPTTVNITTGGTATSGTDYTGGVATVVIPASATTATITINPSVDGTVEADETVILTVAAGTGYTVGAPASATGTILNDDVPSASISVAPAAVAEDGAPNLIYTVTLNQANPSAATTVNYTIGGTAVNGTDYATIASPLVIPAGSTTGTITVNPTADATIEADETATLTLAVGTGYTVGVPNSATGTIFNDDLPNLSINDVTVNEGNAGITNFSFTVSLSAPAGPGGVSFNIATANGSATAGVDYVASSLTGQTIPAGSSTYTFTVLVNGDTLNEPSETFFVNVTSVTGAVVIDGQGVGTITNDDPLPSLSINDVTVTEGNSGTVNAVFTVTLSAASGQTVGVNYATANGSAIALGDYVPASGTLSFTSGQTTQTITVSVFGDTVPEANKTFFVNLSGATNATISDNQGLGTITNDDVPVTVNPATLPNGTVAAAYSQAISASGGVAPYAFTVTAGALPAGLTLSSGGVLSGTPTAGGSFNFTVTATDSSGAPGPFAGTQAYTVTIAPPTIVLPATVLAGGTLGTAYSAAITPASGGTAPYAYAVTAGALPGGLTLNTGTGAIIGTPSALGTFNFSITATDSSTGTGPYTATQAYSIVVVAVPPTASNSSLTVAYNAAATNVPLTLGGGTPTSLTIVTAPLHGTAIVTGITITYQPTAGYSGPDSFTYTATNSGGTSAPATVTITVNDPVITITPSSGLAATVGTAYTQTFTFNGGAQPWSGFQVTNLPAGLSITGTTANSVTVSGTPTQAGSFSLNASATDSSTGNGPFSVGQVFPLTVSGPTLALAPTATTFNAPYGAAFSQSFTASGGVGPYTYARTGTLPAGVSFSGNTVSGTPTAPGSFSFTITATDTGSTGTGSPFTVAQNYTINVAAPTIVVNPATLPNPVAGVVYSQTLTATGGVAPYGFAVSAGSLPSGITLTTGGALSGTSNQVGTFNFTVTGSDANGQTGTRAYTLTIAAPTLTMTPAAGTLTAPYGAAYTQTFTSGGSAGPFNYVLTGALPTGVTFSGGVLSGTPTVPGSFPITVTATDTVLTGLGAPFSIAQNYTLNVPTPTIVVNPATLPNPAAGVAYSQAITVSGGVAPYSTTVSSGSLPTGITLTTGGALSGTSNQVGSFPITITATDANGQAGNRAYTLIIAAPTLTLTPAAGILTAPYGAAYSQVFTAGGSAGPFNYVLTGALPAGVTFSGNTLSGTPTAPGSYPINVRATDTVLTGLGAPFSILQSYTLNVLAPTIVVNPATLPNAVAGTGYAANLTATGGVAPYTFAVSSGSLPPGLALGPNGILSANTTTSGTFNFTVTATDANGQTGNRAYSVVIAVPTLSVTPGTLPAGIAGTLYSQALSISGGIAPYTVTQTGTLPTGVTFNTAARTFTGTPTQSGTFNVSVTVTDSTGGTAATVTNAYTLTIASPTLALTPATVPASTAGVAYSQNFVASGGIAPYTYALSAGALPTGLTLNAAGALSGTPTVAGTFTFSVRATDSTAGTPATVANAYTLTVSAPIISITQTALPGAVFAVAYNQTLAATGGTAPYVFSVSAGALPTGLALSSTGVISGTPTALGTFNFTIRAADALGFSGTRAFTVVVVERPDPSKDAQVLGMLDAQAASTRRFAEAQIGNFRQHLESLHDGGAAGSKVSNGLNFSATNAYGSNRQCKESEFLHDSIDCPASALSGSAAQSANANSSQKQNGDALFNLWAGGLIRTGDRDATTGRAGFDFESDGVSIGADYRFNSSFVMGAGLGVGRDSTDVGLNGSRVDGDAYTAALYSSFHSDAGLYIDGLAAYQWLSYDLQRYVTNTGGKVFGQRDGTQWLVSLSAGAEYQRDALQFSPYARWDYASASLDAYTEQGDAVWALRFNEQAIETSTLSLGLRADYRYQTNWGAFSPQFRIEYQHDLKNNEDALLTYADSLTGPFYRASLLGIARNRFELGLGGIFEFDNDWNFRVEYRHQQGDDDQSNSLQLNVEKKF